MNQSELLTFLICLFFMLGCHYSDRNENNDCYEKVDLENVLFQYEEEGVPIAKIDFSKPLNPAWTQADFQIFRQFLEEVNPNIYRYTTKSTLDSLFEAKLCQLKDSIDYLQFIRQIAEVYNTVACGHSGWMHTHDFKQYRETSMKFFPLDLISLDNRYFVTHNLSPGSSISVGDEIVSINNTTPQELNNRLRSYMYKDGTSAPNANKGISKYFRNAYSNFIDNPQTFKLTLKKESGRLDNIEINAQSRTVIDSISRARNFQPEKIGIPLRLKIDSIRDLGIYTIKWFRNEYIEHCGQNFNLFTDSVFQTLKNKGIENLIIDLRDNHGGWTANGKKLFSYFINEPMDYVDKVELSRIDSFSLAPLILSDQGIQDSMLFERSENELYQWSNYPNLKVHPADENRFEGNVYILINEESRSCSAVFSSLMRSHTEAVFIGEENGGAQCGQSGMVISAILPYTGVIVNSSTAKYTLNVDNPQNSRGIKVDYPVKADINSVLKGEDPQMNQAFELINKRSTARPKLK